MPDIKVLRWKLILHKFSKLIGMYDAISDKNERFALINNLFILFVFGHAYQEGEMTDLDLRNLDDLIVIGVEILHETKLFDQTVLNPVNFIQLTLLDYALQKSPGNKTFLFWQTKLYSKLGMTSLVNDLCGKLSKDMVPGSSEFEKVGVIRYSHYSEFLCDRELDMLCRQYKRHFETNSNDGKNKIVEAFKRREFDKIGEMMQQGSG